MAPSPDSQGNSDANYVVVARRYRPRGFDELVGQDSVGQALKNAIETNRVGHAYLFTGARGVGKTSTARIFAKALNDPGGPTARPDNQSDVALAIDSGEDVDVIEIDGASNRGIDEIRSLRANVGVRPSRSRYKIYIIDEVHMLTPAAFNALLKTLEEPPEHVKFIFCTTDPEKIPITVLSRCQRFDFAPVEVAKIKNRLQDIITAEGAEAEDAALELIARRAAGSMRDSQSLLEQVLSFSNGRLTADQVHAMLGTADDQRLHALAAAMADRDAAETLRQMDAGIDAGVDAGRLAEQLLGYFRDLMAVAVGSEASMLRHTSLSMFEELKALADRWGLQTVLAIVALIDQTLVRIRHSVYSRVLLEATLIQICQLPDLQRLADLAAAARSSAAKASPATNAGGMVKPVELAREKKNLTPADHAIPSISHEAVTKPHSPHGSVSRPHDATTRRSSSLAKAAATIGSVDSAGSFAPAVGTESTSSATETCPPANESAIASADRRSAAPAGSSATALGERPWNQETLHQWWPDALVGIDPMTETLARSVDRIQPVGDSILRLIFPASARMAMSRCNLPEHKNAIAAAMSDAVGRPITLELICDAAPVAALAPVKKEKRLSGKERMERMRHIEAHPMIQACIEQFAAEIVKIDEAR